MWAKRQGNSHKILIMAAKSIFCLFVMQKKSNFATCLSIKRKEIQMISVEGLKVEFGTTPLFEDVSFVINKKDRIALVGKNGAGKSTMLKILAGLQQPTEGVVAVQRGITIGYLPQVMILSDTRTVMAEAEMAFEHIFEMQEKLEKILFICGLWR